MLKRRGRARRTVCGAARRGKARQGKAKEGGAEKRPLFIGISAEIRIHNAPSDGRYGCFGGMTLREMG